MLIVSQDRMRVINCDNVTRIHIDEYNAESYIQCDFPNGSYEDLGIYETEQRAVEVLENIIDAFAPRKPQNLTELANYRQMAKYVMPEE